MIDMGELGLLNLHMTPGWLGVIIVAAAGCALIYLLRYCYAGASPAKSVIKTMSVLLLALAAWVSGGAVSLILALCLCALGDFLLSRDGEGAFMAGVGAFAAGHLAYMYLFLTHVIARPELISGSSRRSIVLFLLLVGVIMGGLLWRKAGALRWAVMAYIPIILSMGIAVLALPGLGALHLAFWAAGLFLISDVVLAHEMFVFRAGGLAKRIAPFVVWPTYWLAQLGFYLAFAGIALK